MAESEDELRSITKEFIDLMADIFGPEQAQRLQAIVDSADWRQAVSSPLTWQVKLKSLIEDAFAGVEVDSARLLELMPSILEMQQRTKAEARARDEEMLAGSPAARDLADYLVELADKVGDDRVLALLPSQWIINGTEGILGGSPGFARLASDGVDHPESITFEERIKVLSAALAHSSERIYRPLLEAALALTQVEHAGTPTLPTELGRLLSACRKRWHSDRPSLLPLLDDNVRILRNSEAHRQTQIDVVQNTVTFVNKHPSRGLETFGPLNNEQFAAFVRHFYNLCVAIHAALSSTRMRILGIR